MKSAIKKTIAPILIALLAVLVFAGIVSFVTEEAYLSNMTVDKLTGGNINYYDIGSFSPSAVGTQSGNPDQPPSSYPVQYQTYNQIQTQLGNTVQTQRVPSEGYWLGMEIERSASKNGLTVEVSHGSVAEKAGMRNDDIITAINGLVIANMADYVRATKNERITTADIEILRNGTPMLISVSPETGNWMAGSNNIQPLLNTVSNAHSNQKYKNSSTSTIEQFNKMRTPPISTSSPMTHEYRGVCSKCHQVMDYNMNSITHDILHTGNISRSNTGLPSPAQQNAAHKVLVEGHWLGMELIPISPELAREYRLPDDIHGLLVDEVTLESAESGLLAGDIIQSINGYPIKNLKDFTYATRAVESFKETDMGVLRNGRPLTIRLRSSWGKLGVSQNEAAQPIKPGAISPHQNRRRPCTDCHIIMNNGGQLPIDAGDILPTPPPIMSFAKAPHQNRGICSICHVIVNK